MKTAFVTLGKLEPPPFNEDFELHFKPRVFGFDLLRKSWGKCLASSHRTFAPNLLLSGKQKIPQVMLDVHAKYNT